MSRPSRVRNENIELEPLSRMGEIWKTSPPHLRPRDPNAYPNIPPGNVVFKSPSSLCVPSAAETTPRSRLPLPTGNTPPVLRERPPASTISTPSNIGRRRAHRTSLLLNSPARAGHHAKMAQIFQDARTVLEKENVSAHIPLRQLMTPTKATQRRYGDVEGLPSPISRKEQQQASDGKAFEDHCQGQALQQVEYPVLPSISPNHSTFPSSWTNTDLGTMPSSPKIPVSTLIPDSQPIPRTPPYHALCEPPASGYLSRTGYHHAASSDASPPLSLPSSPAWSGDSEYYVSHLAVRSSPPQSRTQSTSSDSRVAAWLDSVTQTSDLAPIGEETRHQEPEAETWIEAGAREEREIGSPLSFRWGRRLATHNLYAPPGLLTSEISEQVAARAFDEEVHYSPQSQTAVDLKEEEEEEDTLSPLSPHVEIHRGRQSREDKKRCLSYYDQDIVPSRVNEETGGVGGAGRTWSGHF